MDPISFVHALQITDSFFPVGAFAYSDGLETAAAAGIVRDGVTLSDWMNHFLDGVFVPCEGLALLKAMLAAQAEDFETLARIDQELAAIRCAAEVRASSVAVGKRLLSLYRSLCADDRLATCCATLPHGTAAVAYGVVFACRNISPHDGLLAFGYSRLTGIVSTALRLNLIGHQQGQIVLTKTLERLPDAADRILGRADQPILSFSPALDIQQMNHQYLYSRLFRS